MASWTTFPPHTRKELCHQWEKFALILKDSGGGKCIYNAPNCGIPDCGRKLLCRNALLRIFNIGYRKYANACEDPSKRHSNTGKKGSTSAKGKHMKEVYDSLHSFFAELTSEAAPFATRIIRDRAGLNTRDDDPNDVSLPPSMTKHRCYAKWCYDNGWIVKKKSRSLTIYEKVKNYDKRPFDDDSEVPLWPTGSQQKKICTWPCFLAFWKTNYKHIKVRAKGADTCTDCLIFMNCLKVLLVQTEERMKPAVIPIWKSPHHLIHQRKSQTMS